MKNKRGIKKSEQQLFLKACIMAEVYMSFETFCNVSITEIQNQCQNPRTQESGSGPRSGFLSYPTLSQWRGKNGVQERVCILEKKEKSTVSSLSFHLGELDKEAIYKQIERKEITII